jgi:hypothetical protein
MDAFMNLPPGTNLMTVPLAINPHGQPPNLVDPPSLEPAMLDVGIILIVTSGPLLTLRLYANAKHTRKLYLDDGKLCNRCMIHGTKTLRSNSILWGGLALCNCILGHHILYDSRRLCRSTCMGYAYWSHHCTKLHEGMITGVSQDPNDKSSDTYCRQCLLRRYLGMLTCGLSEPPSCCSTCVSSVVRAGHASRAL